MSQTVHSTKQLSGPLQICPQLPSPCFSRVLRVRRESGMALAATVVRVAKATRRDLRCMLVCLVVDGFQYELRWRKTDNGARVKDLQRKARKNTLIYRQAMTFTPISPQKKTCIHSLHV